MTDKQKTQNNVHSDQIWRQKINYELHTASAWEKNWGFMRTTANAVKLPPIYKHDARRSGLPSRQAPGLDKNLILSYNIPEVIKTKSLNEKYHYPPTTASDLGWKWHQTNLERFGNNARGRGNVLKWYGCPEALA